MPQLTVIRTRFLPGGNARYGTKSWRALTAIRGFLMVVSCFMTGFLHAEMPEKLSKFEGWKGVKIVKAQTEHCPNCCDIVFPPSFAKSSDDELKDLLSIIRHERPKEFDLKCTTSPSFNAMGHLVYLAANEQIDSAADILLRPDNGLKLDGEALEIFAVERQLPVLLGYKKAKSLIARYPGLDGALVKRFVYDLCNEWGYFEYKEKREKIPIGLKNNGLNHMAVEFSKQCSVSVQSNPDIQRMLRGK